MAPKVTVDKDKRLAADLFAMKESSRQWMDTNYYQEFRDVWRNYKCEREPEADPNDQDKVDLESNALGMPDTWAIIQRKAARATAQLPNLRYRDNDKERAQRVSWKLMRDWDRGGVQAIQKRHITQALLFGWSVRPWHWATEEFPRTRRVDPWSDEETDQAAIEETFGEALPPEVRDVRADDPLEYTKRRNTFLVKEYGRGRPPLLPVTYNYKKYVGPKTDFLFVGDCFPEPRFTSLHTSAWFIVQRERSQDWLKRLAKEFPHLKDGVNRVLVNEPNGTNPQRSSDMFNELREQLAAAEEKTDINVTGGYEARGAQRKWLITEVHIPGPNSKIYYVSEGSNWIGEIDYPYDLDGKIAFSELVPDRDLLYGIGNADARIIRGLQELHNTHVSQRYDLVYNLLRPYAWTTNPELWEDPGMIKRGAGMRLLPALNGPGEFGIINEGPALASAAAGMADTQQIQAYIQQASGESNMSMSGDIDPQQARTATGARLLAYNQDTASRSLLNAINFSIKDDAEIMYLLNRSELDEPISLDVAQYSREFNPEEQEGQPTEVLVDPLDFQTDGEVVPEVGSTLADDDEAKVEQAQFLFAQAQAAPHIFNVEKARDDLLIALGKGRDLTEYVAPPPPPEPPPPPTPLRVTMSLRWELLSPEERQYFMENNGALMVEMPGTQSQAQPPGQASPPAIEVPGVGDDSAIGPATAAAMDIEEN